MKSVETKENQPLAGTKDHEVSALLTQLVPTSRWGYWSLRLDNAGSTLLAELPGLPGGT
jgi:hypothetical protein